MGCDIHMILERRHPEKKWIGVQLFRAYSKDAFALPDAAQTHLHTNFLFWRVMSRNYLLFAALAGVRGKGPMPRGIPDDASDLARAVISNWNGDGHSYSWGLLSEIGGLFMAHYLPKDILAEERVSRMMRLFGADSFVDQPEDYRLVYFFDN